MNTPEHWRERARQCRLLAEMACTPSGFARHEEKAAEYERLAARLEQDQAKEQATDGTL